MCATRRDPMRIVKYPHPALRHKAEPITALSKEIELLAGGMLELIALLDAVRGVRSAAGEEDGRTDLGE